MSGKDEESGKPRFAVLGFMHGALTLLLAAVSLYLGTKDTSPKSLESIASTLGSIDATLKAGGSFNEQQLATVGEIVKYTSAIEGTIVEKAAGSQVPGVDAVLVVGGEVPIRVGQTISMTLASGDRVSATYSKPINTVYQFVVNGRAMNATQGNRLFKSADGTCFVEFLSANEEKTEVQVRPFCN